MNQGLYIQNGELVTISAFSNKIKAKFAFTNSLKFRILILTILIGLTPVLLVSGIIRNVNRTDAVNDKINSIRNQSQIIATQLATTNYSASNVSETLGDSIMQLSSALGARIILIDQNCKVLKDSYALSDSRTAISSEAIKAMKNKKVELVTTRDGNVSCACPVFDATQTNIKGAVVVLASTTAEVIKASELGGRITIMEIVAGLIVIAIAIFASNVLVKPFETLSESIAEVSEGYSGEDLSFEGYSELHKLSDALNTMVGKLQTLDDSRQEFVSNVSHELKTPITSMKVLADSLLVQEDVPVELYKEFMLDIADEIDRENKIINDLLALVKLDKSSSDLNIAPITINEMIELILKRLRPIAARRNIELVFESFRPVTAEVDEVKLTLAFSNLCENAIKYNVDNGWVHVSLNADHKYFYVKVSDSGIGIPEDSIENIYERFYRVDKSHSREIGGTGLGLSITRSAILKHRGSIKVYSKEGEGTTFTVRIPLTYVFQ